MKCRLLLTVISCVIGACSSQRGSDDVRESVAPVRHALGIASDGGLDPSQIGSGHTVFLATAAVPPTSNGLANAPTLTHGSSPPLVADPRAHPKTAVAADPMQAAALSLPILTELVGNEPPAKRGFASAKEAASSTLEDGIPIRFIRLDSLVSFSVDRDTTQLLADMHEVIYPIVASGSVKSSVTVANGPDGQWQAVEFGRTPLAQAIHAIKVGPLAQRTIDAGTLVLVEVPSVHAFLLSHVEKGQHMITPLWDIPGTSFTAGNTVPAAHLLAVLQPLAAAVDPSLPR